MSAAPPESSLAEADTAVVVLTPRRFALVGNPNTGKTTLFNRLCGIRAKTANFPGSTVEARIGVMQHGQIDGHLIDLPGHYGLNLDRPDSRVCRRYLRGEIVSMPPPDAVVVVADATNLARNLIFVSQAIQQGLPAVVALTMSDLTRRQGMSIDLARLGEHVGCPVVRVCARTGEGMDELVAAMGSPILSRASLPEATDAQAAAEWARDVAEACVHGHRGAGRAGDALTDRLDSVFTHPVIGVLVFAAVMTGLFYSIFTLATVPMDLIELLFAHLGAWAGHLLPAGPVHDLVVDGVVAGISGTVVFLPQICLLFFLISLLEDTGYLARAAFVMDRLLRRFGLPGQAFVPLLSAHACAIPAIMSARLIPDTKDRLATILVAPFMSCSARLPVYVLLIGILVGDEPLLAGLAFAGCYTLGALVAVGSSLLARRTILRGPMRPMILELPTYKLPSLRTALLTTFDRGLVFLRKAGTVIVAICIVLWWLGEYPKAAPPAQATSLRAEADALEAVDPDRSAALRQSAGALTRRHAKERSFMGRMGRTLEPVFRPLGFDWQLSVGVLSSLVAREVFVSTMAVVIVGEEDDPTASEGVRAGIVQATRSDGAPLFTTRTAVSLLVYYVLAMQCLPTLVVTRRETGSWKWPLLQLGWMTSLAWILALVVYQGLGLMGVT